jgi:hypothetical protein
MLNDIHDHDDYDALPTGVPRYSASTAAECTVPTNLRNPYGKLNVWTVARKSAVAEHAERLDCKKAVRYSESANVPYA